MDTIDEFMDRRRHRRIDTQSSARINFDGFWHNCPTVDMSGGGGSFRSWLQPPVGSNVLVQMRGLGVIRARVTRRWDQGFAVEFDAEDYDADTLVDNLTLPANPGLFGPGSGGTASKSQAEAGPEVPEDESARPGDDLEPREEEDESALSHPTGSVRKALK